MWHHLAHSADTLWERLPWGRTCLPSERWTGIKMGSCSWRRKEGLFLLSSFSLFLSSSATIEVPLFALPSKFGVHGSKLGSWGQWEGVERREQACIKHMRPGGLPSLNLALRLGPICRDRPAVGATYSLRLNKPWLSNTSFERKLKHFHN